MVITEINSVVAKDYSTVSANSKFTSMCEFYGPLKKFILSMREPNGGFLYKCKFPLQLVTSTVFRASLVLLLLKNDQFRDFPRGPVVKTLCPMQGAQTPSLIRELFNRLCMLQLRFGTAKYITNIKKPNQPQIILMSTGIF